MARPETPESTDSTETDLRPPPGRVYSVVLATAAIVVALDQITKSLALENLRDGPVDLIKGAVTFDLSFNSGGVFGLLQGFPGIFLFATIAVVLAILVWVRNLEESRWLVPLGMILGGGLGNLSDRLFRDLGGQVVDFIDLHVWPVFNLADSSIVVGVVLILLFGVRSRAAAPSSE
ncbi:MAG: signal peptidase II [Actinomycetota bacterium]|nr:signal peptidase II [Actinomycetota bacterium]